VELHRLIRENSKNESEYKQLMDSLKQSVLTAFYTPPSVTEALADTKTIIIKLMFIKI
jgi:hypothetical protein